MQDCHCYTTWQSLATYAIVVGQSYKTNAKAFHHTLSLSHTCSAWRRTSHFQNHHERSAQRKRASKARKNSTSWPWNRRSCGPKFGPRSGPRRKYTHTRKTVSQNLISAVIRLLGGFKNEPRKWTRFGGRLSQTRGQKKGSAWVAPWIPRSPVNALFSTTPPISTPQQLSSDMRRRYTHCNASLGNSHKAINQSEAYVKTPNTLFCFHSEAELQLFTLREP